MSSLSGRNVAGSEKANSPLERFTYEMASRIAENSPLAIAVIKKQLHLLAGSSPLSSETF